MVAATILFALAAALGALAWTLWPLLDKTPAPVLVEDDRLAEMIARKEAVIAAIRDLEFDYRVGKLTEEDYQRYDQRLRRQAIGYMQQIEQIAPASTELERGIEAEIARHRRVPDGSAVASSVAAQVTATPGMAAPSRAAPSRAAAGERVAAVALPASPTPQTPRTNGSSPRFCTNCGQPLQTGNKFCAHCGTAVGA